MNKAKIQYLTLSDIHAGHPRTTTEYIINSLDTYFEVNRKAFSKLDIITLAGDVYDRLLASNSAEFILANEWLSRLAIFCSKHNIKLRILEGTPSHDWKQVSVFAKTLASLNIELDYKYIQDLSVEYMEDLGINVLYVPDEWNHKSEDTVAEIKELYQTLGIRQVDIAFMHGAFHYQLPMITLESSFDEKTMMSLVKYYINIGHVHIHSAYDRILAQGSFERLAAGEEGAKGGMVMTIYHSGNMEFRFIENKLSYPYKSYNLEDMDTCKVVATLEKNIKKLKPGTRVTVTVNNNEVCNLLKPLVNKYQGIYFTIKKKKVKRELVTPERVASDAFEITKDNIVELLTAEVSKHHLTKQELEILHTELNAVV